MNRNQPRHAAGDPRGGQFAEIERERGTIDELEQQAAKPRRGRPSLPRNAINSNEARRLAEAKWGKGGTSSHQTFRNGVYYFICSGHGGYVFDDNVISDEERAGLYLLGYEPERVLTLETSDGELVTMYTYYQSLSPRKLSIQVPRDGRSYFLNDHHKVWMLEEDCEWVGAEIVLNHTTTLWPHRFMRFATQQPRPTPEQVASELMQEVVDVWRRWSHPKDKEAAEAYIADTIKWKASFYANLYHRLIGQ